jgi:hypothetical protein
MYATRHESLEVEFLHWLLLIVLAIATVLLVASALGAAEPMPTPRLLPEGIGTWAKPLAPETPKPYFPESPPPRSMPAAQAAADLWTILDNHRAGRASDALAGWQRLGLPDVTAHWREIARGAAYLQLGDLERAEWHLFAARQLAPDQAATAYFLGVLRMEQAAQAMRVPDGHEPIDAMVAYHAESLAAQSKERSLRQQILRDEMQAIGELETAIGQVRGLFAREALLLADNETYESVVIPTVGDLLDALSADRLAGRAHHLLFGLELKHGQLPAAEFHLDEAAKEDLPVLYGYQDLAMAYATAGMHADAIRTYSKGWTREYPLLKQVAASLQQF